MDEIGQMGRIFLARRRRLSQIIRPFDISLDQLHFIRLARRRGAIAPSEAARELFCDRPTATVIANNCVARGWLKRRRSVEDRRSTRFVLSGTGEELLDRIEAAGSSSDGGSEPGIAARGAVGDALDVLSEEERAAFDAFLARIHERAMELYLGPRRPLP
ncbi:MAG TPA: MarR family transcriptional regulator [Rectinemataceae bacterium]|nr:MarR family transcriptional regulator [Rectinemataceae bacterium]